MKIILSAAVAIILSETDKAFRQPEKFECVSDTAYTKNKKRKNLVYGRYV